MAVLHCSEVVDDPEQIIKIASSRLQKVDISTQVKIIKRETDHAVHLTRLHASNFEPLKMEY